MAVINGRDNHNDSLTGGSANDVIDGKSGDDTLFGAAGNDALYGRLGDDLLSGGDGDDTLVGGPGDDTLDGGAGRDTVSYADATAGVAFQLGGPAASSARDAAGGTFGFDTLISIENVLGSDFHDNFQVTDNSVDKVLDGGSGNDTVEFYLFSSDVAVSLAADGPQDILNAGIDTTVLNFENLWTGGGDDMLTGNAKDNRLGGGFGQDTLYGGAGNDNLRGYWGNMTYPNPYNIDPSTDGE